MGASYNIETRGYNVVRGAAKLLPSIHLFREPLKLPSGFEPDASPSDDDTNSNSRKQISHDKKFGADLSWRVFWPPSLNTWTGFSRPIVSRHLDLNQSSLGYEPWVGGLTPAAARIVRIELTSKDWQSYILPLNHTRILQNFAPAQPGLRIWVW